jgi:hypothetical protein
MTSDSPAACFGKRLGLSFLPTSTQTPTVDRRRLVEIIRDRGELGSHGM